jgi:DNA polymerase III epsilon subunit-like protein
MSSAIIVERTLIFDVETTGFLADASKGIAKQPYITQLSFVIANIYKETGKPIRNETEREFNHYIAIPDEVEIPIKVVKLTGITKDKCKTLGIPIEVALFEFYQEFVESNFIVSHNIDFDSKMILLEMQRNYQKVKDLGCWTPYAIFNPMFNKFHNIRIYCTMKEGINVTNLYTKPRKTTSRNTMSVTESQMSTDSSACSLTASLPVKEGNKKKPKLIELYTFLYPERPIPFGLHDSMVDTKVCMECYLKMITLK